jgi:hypothetical protein
LYLIENLKALLSYLNTQPKWLLLSRKSEFMQTMRLLFIVYAPLLTNLHKLSNFVAFKLATPFYLKVQQSPSTRFLDTMMLLEIKEQTVLQNKQQYQTTPTLNSQVLQ